MPTNSRFHLQTTSVDHFIEEWLDTVATEYNLDEAYTDLLREQTHAGVNALLQEDERTYLLAGKNLLAYEGALPFSVPSELYEAFYAWRNEDLYEDELH